MKKIFPVFTVLTCGCTLLAQKPAPMPKFEEAVSFYIAFDDETPDADISVGKEKPFLILGKKHAPSDKASAGKPCSADRTAANSVSPGRTIWISANPARSFSFTGAHSKA